MLHRDHSPPAHERCAGLVAALGSLLIALAGCGPVPAVKDPLAALADHELSPRVHERAMTQLDAEPPSEAYTEALEEMLWRVGFTPAVREEAARRLLASDPEALRRTLRRYLPRMVAPKGRAMLCDLIAEQGWVDLTPALVSSLARLSGPDELLREQAEYRALVELHGEEQVADAIFELLRSARRVSDQPLRKRCWTLLNRLGERERLVQLLLDADLPPDDAFLLDLQIGARELGLVPHNGEEILWMRKLRDPSRRRFWEEASAAVSALPASRRETLEMRDLSVVVSAARHRPELLTRADADLYRDLEQRLRGRRHYSHGSNFDNFNPGRRERLGDWRRELMWSDLLAMHMAVTALEVTPVVAHLFDYAERDRADETTEYGGVLSLDRQGRFEVIEFPPRIRRHDQMFMASQDMLDTAYTALFHFHLHVQRYRNEDYAGPGFGDLGYADNTRANCLVFTFVDEQAMNVDYYRHDRVLVDLGVVDRPTGPSSVTGAAPAWRARGE